jgi:GNAT superfamily N-acetyltransferase
VSDPQWSIRPYRPGDERGLAALWTATFGKPMTEEHWRWKLQGRPSAIDNVGIAVAADDRPIAQFGGIPCPARVLGAPRDVMIGVDVMTAPGFRNQGVFTATARSALQRWREAGVALVLGLANDRWRRRADALGYERLFPLRRFVRILRADRVLARRLGIPLPRPPRLARWWQGARERSRPTDPALVLRSMGAPTAAFDSLWQKVGGEGAITLVRDRAWVMWRYTECPLRVYQLLLAERAGVPAGYAVFSVVRDPRTTYVTVPEVFAPGDPEAFRALVQESVARAQREDADTVVTFAVPGSAAACAFRAAGFRMRRSGWSLEVNRLDPAIPASALRDPAAWWVSAGDFDVI